MNLGEEPPFDFKDVGIHTYDKAVWKGIYYGGIYPVRMAGCNSKLDIKLVIDYGLTSGLCVCEYDSVTCKRIHTGGAAKKVAGFSYEPAINLDTTYGI